MDIISKLNALPIGKWSKHLLIWGGIFVIFTVGVIGLTLLVAGVFNKMPKYTISGIALTSLMLLSGVAVYFSVRHSFHKENHKNDEENKIQELITVYEGLSKEEKKEVHKISSVKELERHLDEIKEKNKQEDILHYVGKRKREDISEQTIKL